MTDSTRFEVVSNDDEPLILVDGDDQQIGTLDKSACHDGDGKLHRAFSLFVFNSQGATLLQQRHSEKRLWPGFWSNGCCSHPRNGESIDEAVVRRAHEELGLLIEPRFLFKFQYRASFLDVGSEFELCSVFVGRTSNAPQVNTSEIEDWQWILPDDLDKKIQQERSIFTPWLVIEWKRLRSDFAHEFQTQRDA